MKTVESSAVFQPKQWAEKASREDNRKQDPTRTCAQSGVKIEHCSRCPYATAAVIAVKQATSVIPIVFAGAADPVGTGLVASLARPAGNVTGVSLQTTDIAGKRLELLRDVVPDLRRFAIMANADSTNAVLELNEAQVAAGTLGIDVLPLKIRRGEDIAPA